LFELPRLRHVAVGELMEKWEHARKRAQEKVLMETVELERRMNELGETGQAAEKILNDILPFLVPEVPWQDCVRKGLHGDCALHSGGRLRRPQSCAICEEIFADGEQSHAHLVAGCPANTLGLEWYPDERRAKKVFRKVQRERQIRQLRAEFQRMESGLRERVFEKVEKQLKDLHISREDVLRAGEMSRAEKRVRRGRLHLSISSGVDPRVSSHG
jgi:hypothetical protein